MRVLMLSWEYPPVVVGGLGRHVHALARHVAALGHDVVVLCRHEAGTDADTHPTADATHDGVRVIRVAEDPCHLVFAEDLVAWTLAMGHAMIRAGLRLLGDWHPDVVHAHDWLVTHPAIALADQARVPLVATLHATEAGRHSGWLSQPLNHQVHSAEWWLANRADALITCSAAMRAETAHLFDIDPTTVTVIHNGIEPRSWRVPTTSVRETRAAYGDGPLLMFFGRLEWEKGVHDLIAALPKVRRSHPGTRLVIAGRGSQATALADLARKTRVRRAVEFVGHLTDQQLIATLSAADAVVLPSRYEPFGIVALEAAAVGVPLIASTAGGLGEVVIDGETGLSFTPGDVAAIATAIRQVLNDPTSARKRARTAKTRLTNVFDWAKIAKETTTIYRTATIKPHPPLGRPKIPTGNAFA
ncbi:glycosyltransferase family 4 protein [Actinokineospora inagensis]|uniref:glycosyltransferase family 4 protein n=1 Tax=Actinokineospora inagensis TaxID=103730 RepID=UPI00047B22EC|nr:glycosyltransferase family 4 protein [Actinokineospora inagensis]